MTIGSEDLIPKMNSNFIFIDKMFTEHYVDNMSVLSIVVELFVTFEKNVFKVR